MTASKGRPTRCSGSWPLLLCWLVIIVAFGVFGRWTEHDHSASSIRDHPTYLYDRDVQSAPTCSATDSQPAISRWEHVTVCLESTESRSSATLASVAAEGEAVSASDLLQPGGNPIGTAGSDESIREVTGNLSDAQQLFDELSQGGRIVESTSKLTRVELPDGGYVQLRTVMSNSPNTVATIDVNIPGVDISKVKFNP